MKRAIMNEVKNIVIEELDLSLNVLPMNVSFEQMFAGNRMGLATALMRCHARLGVISPVNFDDVGTAQKTLAQVERELMK